MLRRIIAVALLTLSTFGLSGVASQAQAEERTCYSAPQILKFDSYEVCYFLPVEPTS